MKDLYILAVCIVVVTALIIYLILRKPAALAKIEQKVQNAAGDVSNAVNTVEADTKKAAAIASQAATDVKKVVK